MFLCKLCPSDLEKSEPITQANLKEKLPKIVSEITDYKMKLSKIQDKLKSLYQFEGSISSSEFYQILKDISSFTDEKNQIIPLSMCSKEEVKEKCIDLTDISMFVPVNASTFEKNTGGFVPLSWKKNIRNIASQPGQEKQKEVDEDPCKGKKKEFFVYDIDPVRGVGICTED